MRIAICEDTRDDAHVLDNALSRYLETNNLFADVDFFKSGEDFLSDFEPGKYQIIFMDIYMTVDGVTGMDAAEKVNAADKDAAIIFITTIEEYILAGYSVAVFYIVKPVTQESLNKAMEKCRSQIERYAKTIQVVVDRQPVEIRQRDIFWIETINRNCVFAFAKDKMTASGMNLGELTTKLGGSPFIQCHRSFIVNILHVRKMTETEFILENGGSVPIGRKYQTDAKNEYRKCFAKLIMGQQM